MSAASPATPPSPPTPSASSSRSGRACFRSSRRASFLSCPATCRWSRACRPPSSKTRRRRDVGPCSRGVLGFVAGFTSSSPPSAPPPRGSGTPRSSTNAAFEIAAGVRHRRPRAVAGRDRDAGVCSCASAASTRCLRGSGLGPARDGHGVRLRLDAVHRSGPRRRPRPAAARATLPRGWCSSWPTRSGLGVPFLATGLAFGRLTSVMARVRRRLWLVDVVAGRRPGGLRRPAGHRQAPLGLLGGVPMPCGPSGSAG